MQRERPSGPLAFRTAPPIDQGASKVADSAIARISSTSSGGVSARYIASMIDGTVNVHDPQFINLASSLVVARWRVVTGQPIRLKVVFDDRSFVVDADDPDNPTMTFGEFDTLGRPHVLYDMQWALPRRER